MRKFTVIAASLLLLSHAPAFASDACKQWRPIEFHLAESNPGSGLIRLRVVGRTGFIYLHSPTELDDRDIESASVVLSQIGQPSVQVKLRPSGFAKMRQLTKKCLHRQLAIVVNGKVISAPYLVSEQVDELLDIEGSFTLEEAQRLAAALNRKKR